MTDNDVQTDGPTDAPAQPTQEPATPQGSTRASRLTAGGYSGVGAACLVLFFVPWLRLSCDGKEVLTQSGYQIAAGDSTYTDELLREIELAAKGPTGLHARDSQDNAKRRKKLAGSPALWPYCIGLTFVVFFGLIHAAWKPDWRPIGPFLGVAAAAMSIGTHVFFVEFPLEQQFADLTQVGRAPDPGANARPPRATLRPERMPSVERTAAFTAAFVLVCVALVLVCLHYAIAVRRQTLQRRTE